MANSLFNELKRRNVFKVGTAYLVLAWVVVQVTDTAVPALHLPDWVNSLVFYFGAIGFPFALFFAWAFEITPEGVKKEADVIRDSSVTNQTGRILDFIIIGLLIIALAYFMWKSQSVTVKPLPELSPSAANESNKETNTTQDKQTLGASIAVLPFVDMSKEQDQEYFTDGISEEILNVLAKVPNLKVTSRSSSFSFKGKEIIIADVAKKLGVENVLEGSVRKSGTKIRITAQLIEASTDRHLWSETYDRELVDIFKIQDEISIAIVKQLKDKLGLGATVTKRDMSNISREAHNEFFRGKLYIERRNKVDIEKALVHFTKATQYSPDYAAAWMGVAWAQLFLTTNNYGTLLPSEGHNLAKSSIDRALELDPNLPEVHAVMSLLLSHNFEYIKSMQHLEQAIVLNPNYADAYSWLADRVNWQPDWIVTHNPKDAINYAAKAVSLDPLSLLANNNYLENILAFGRYQEAEQIAEHMLEINANHSFAHIEFAEVDIAQGRYGRGITKWEKGLSYNPNNQGWVVIVSQYLNQIGLNEEAAIMLNERNKESFVPWYSADLEGYIKGARNQYPLNEDDHIGMLLRADAETAAGNYDVAIKYYEQSKLCGLCDPLIYSLQQLGKNEASNKLLAERTKRYNKVQKAGVKVWIYNPINYSGRAPIEIVGMNISYLNGDIDQGIRLLEQAITNGYILEQKYKIHPMYAKLRVHTKWNLLAAKSDAHAKRERGIYFKQTKKLHHGI